MKKSIGYICSIRAAIDHRALLGTTMIDASGREAERFLALLLWIADTQAEAALKFK